MKKALAVALTTWLLSLAAGVTALLLANFGEPMWYFIILFAWLLTAGLPTFVSVVFIASVWNGLPFWAFPVAASFSALLLQCGAVLLIRWGFFQMSRKSAQP